MRRVLKKNSRHPPFACQNVSMPRVNPEILSWARKTAGFSQSDAVEKLGINDARGVAAVDRLAAIESGAKKPNRPLLLKMAKHYRRPTFTFFIRSPPANGDRGEGVPH